MNEEGSCETVSNEPGQAVPVRGHLQTPGYRGVNVEKVANGFIVRIGCQTLVAKTWDEVSLGLGEYWDDPVKAEKKFCR